LHLSDSCKICWNSCANFPSTYNREGVDKIANSQESYREFAGTTVGFNLRIREYEVFRVLFQ
jgi:hypothetical protein